MKKLLLLISLGLIIINSGFSQISQNTAKKLFKQSNEVIQNLKDYSKLEGNFDVLGKICSESWGLDSLDNLVKNGEGTMTLEQLGGDKYKMTQDQIQIDEDGLAQEIVSEIYIKGLPTYEEDPHLDSMIISVVQAGIKIPIIWQRYYYDSGNLTTTVSQMNYALFGLPIGIALLDSTNYYYDNKNFLTAKSSYGLSFVDFSVGISDSTAYTNNAKGFATESINYQPDYSGNILPTGRYTYEYDSQDRVVKEESYVNPDNWTLSGKTSTDYQSKITIALRENTSDAGTSWESTNLDSTYFTVDLPLGFPNRTASYEFVDNDWKISVINISKDCSGTATQNIENLSFVSRFENDDIVISSDQMINNANVTLYNTNGQVVFNQRFNIVPERISTYNLLPGIYILKIDSKDLRGVNKLIKF